MMLEQFLFLNTLLHIDPLLALINQAQILHDTCCPNLKFESNDINFLNTTYHSEAYNIGPLGPNSNSTERGTTKGATNGPDYTDYDIDLPIENHTYGDLLSFDFAPILITDDGNHVYYPSSTDGRIRLMNNYTTNDTIDGNTTKTIWAIYDMTTKNMVIIDILASDDTKCPKCKPHTDCSREWGEELNARVHLDNGTIVPIKNLTVECIEHSSNETETVLPPSPQSSIQTPTGNGNTIDVETTSEKTNNPTRANPERSIGSPTNRDYYKEKGLLTFCLLVEIFGI